jgi:phosphate starvation-inducible protein PhoH and related proteins
MIEKVIYLEGIDPLNIYGPKNAYFELIRKAFPKLKIVARGNEIKVAGDEGEIGFFEEKIDLIIEFYQKFNKLNRDDIENLLGKDARDHVSKAKEGGQDVLLFGNNGKPVKARTVNQEKLVEQYAGNDLLMAVGPAGTGKTYTAIALAVMSLRNKEVKRIVLCRPAVEAGERLGYLPGDLKEKLDPYLQPLYDALNDMIPSKKLKTLMEENVIEIAPLAYMRGRTLSNAVVILDEAQNTTVNQLKMFLTRMGMGSRFIITGDITQIDLPEKQESGLVRALKILENVSGISIVRFDERDIIRHKLVKYIVEAYKKIL